MNSRVFLLVFAAASLGLPSANAQEPAGGDQAEIPYGLWSWARPEAPTTLELRIQRQGQNWTATVNGQAVNLSQDASGLRIEAGEHGWFEGSVDSSDGSIRGVWRQPSDEFAYLDMATPLSLPQVDTVDWQTSVALQPRPFRFFLHVFQNDEGDPRAVIRNPERNEVQGALFYNVLPSTDSDFVLQAGNDTWSVSHAVEVTSEGMIRLEVPWVQDEPLVFERATELTQIGYRARDEVASPIRYQVPEALGDGWAVAAASEHGFDESILDDLVEDLSTTDPTARHPRRLHSLLVARGGALVFEEYFHGYGPQDVHDTRSLAKVFGPIMVGALQHQGIDIGADTRAIADVLDREGLQMDDARKADITLRDLMLYQSGLDCSGSSESLGSEARMWSQTEEPNYWSFVAQLPVLHDPGEIYAYCSGSADVIGSAIAYASDQSVLDVWNSLIAEPLNFAPYHLNLSPAGSAYLGGGTYMRPRDLLKLGQVYVSGGVWSGERILPEAWVEESTTPGIAISPETTGLSEEEFFNNYFSGDQAYVWRVNTIEVDGQSYRSYESTGNGGQIILVVPDLDMVVAMTGGNYRQGWVWGHWRNELVGGYLIPALLASQ